MNNTCNVCSRQKQDLMSPTGKVRLIIRFSVSSVNKTLWERILGRRCIRHIGMYISWEFACTSVQGLMIESTEY